MDAEKRVEACFQQVPTSHFMKYKNYSVIFKLNSLYLSFLYFRMFWLSDGTETQELLLYKYMLYSVFMVYPLFIFSTLMFSKEVKAGFFLKFFIWLMILLGPALFFYTFDLYQQKELLYGSILTVIQCLIQSRTIKDDELLFRAAGVFAAKLLLWFFVLLLSMISLVWYSDRDILTNMLAGGIYYFCVAILDMLIDKYKFLSEK